jgi:hypothetical protein
MTFHAPAGSGGSTTSIKYERERLSISENELSGWTAQLDPAGDPRVEGSCPKCKDNMTYTVTTEHAVLYGFRAEWRIEADWRAEPDWRSEPDRRLTASIGCNCMKEHAGRDAAKLELANQEQGCGRYWSVSIEPQQNGSLAVKAAADPYLIAAAEAVRHGANPELTTIRSAAEKWIAGITALFGLFTLTGIITGAEDVRKLDAFFQILFGTLVALAVILAGMAIWNSYKAAYGWPQTVIARTNPELAKLYTKWRDAPGNAAKNLRRAAQLAAGSLGAVLLAVFVLWYAPQEEAGGANVRLTLSDQSQSCGVPLSAEKEGAMRLRNESGKVQTIELTKLTKVDGVESC